MYIADIVCAPINYSNRNLINSIGMYEKPCLLVNILVLLLTKKVRLFEYISLFQIRLGNIYEFLPASTLLFSLQKTKGTFSDIPTGNIPLIRS